MSESYSPPRFVRSIGAVLAGVLSVVVLSISTDMTMHASGVFPPWGEPMSDALFVFATIYRSFYAFVGGYLAARLAPDRPVLHALALGAVGLALGTVGALATWNAGPEFGPKWYPIAIVVTAIPCAWVGGKLVTMQSPG